MTMSTSPISITPNNNSFSSINGNSADATNEDSPSPSSSPIPTVSSPPRTSKPITKHQWEVHKFGGTSVASPECYRNVLNIILDVRAQQRELSKDQTHRLCVVVSAMGEVKLNSHVSRTIMSYHETKKGVSNYRVEKVDKVTNQLILMTQLAAAHDPMYKVYFEDLKSRHLKVVEECINEQLIMEYEHEREENERSSPHYMHYDHNAGTTTEISLALLHMKESLRGALEKDFDDLSFILRACWLSRSCDLDHSWWFGYGELWSARLLCTLINAVLVAQGKKTSERAIWLDAREVLVLARTREPMPDFSISQEKLDIWLESSSQTQIAPIVVVTGYIASHLNGTPTTLGRDGSDYTASIFAALLRASAAIIWTDVDGVYSANPNQVKDAVLIDELSYDEASELAYFGAKVLHPKTMTPVLGLEIPIWIKNTFNTKAKGSCILSRRLIAERRKEREESIQFGVQHRLSFSDAHVLNKYGVKGISEISNLCLIEVKGSGVLGVPGVASRLFNRLREAGLQVMLVTQAGSELSMSIALTWNQGDIGVEVLRREFRDELVTKEILAIDKIGPCACLAVVGDGMRNQIGVAGRVFTALADARVNIQAIAQGSSERNISAIIAQKDATTALVAVHSAFLTDRQESL